MFNRKEVAAAVLGVAMSVGAPATVAESSSPNQEFDSRVAVVTPREIVVCDVNENNILAPASDNPQREESRFWIMDNANCSVSNGEQLRVLENVRADLVNIGRVEITDLGAYRNQGTPVPQVFETIPGGAVFTSSVNVDGRKDQYNFRTAVFTPNELVVCYSDIEPDQKLGPSENLQPYSVNILDADCRTTNGKEFQEFNDVDASLYNMNGAEVVNLKSYRDQNAPIPSVFESRSDGATFIQN